SKSKAAAFLAQKLDVKRENVISVGNDYNDMDLLEWSGKGFVVENALNDLKEMFEQVPSNNHSGVCAAVEKCIKA
ncbi:MAG: HAD hydrolase family protein, partial [Desulfobacteraceae bacterium]|nr:HAD hydrolase family protein [Desulfobacteraceae bacterium]